MLMNEGYQKHHFERRRLRKPAGCARRPNEERLPRLPA